ncbi:Gfo/Idh/MocA family protein [Paenibacillus pasadenensis]|uniref:Gluconokinase n=1 Tax=Paenibacillus pasadenensis TaxID=217090 RepID=A0A2N5N154_9BACL|nr:MULTISPECIES: Gfo/Idh/MocA family oxidoreductase [Paenibacillus]PLT44045.1 Gluconokinase [Paenibacillus pasadenensis]QGG54593.1 gfo/Idh/MocA family oxidoreductase [Paenibacillus sp. B01]
MNQDPIRIGVIGLGNMGSAHAGYLARGEVEGAVLTAVADPVAARRDWAQEQLGNEVRTYGSTQELIASGEVDAVLIATPHYAHPEEAKAAFRAGLHVLVEKPAGVYTKQVREMNEAAAASGRVFSLMYNQRMNPLYRKMRELIADGELGELRRINWIITDWYRPQSYYDSGGWRATWAGEGGGVLMNQSPHNLDLFQWITGLMPSRIRAFCGFGKHRDIEVENDVTAYAEYANGATGVFITSTCDAPGTNRLEISGERGKLVAEDGKLTFWRLRVPEPEFNRDYKGGFGSPETWRIEVPLPGGDPQHHRAVTRNWVDGIRTGAPLAAPGEEGIRGLELCNAMLLSTWTDGWVELPLDEERYLQALQERIDASSSRKDPAAAGARLDVQGTH